jgi:uncharacterized membrane protein YkoI
MMKKLVYMLAIAVLLAPVLPAWGKEHGDHNLTQVMAFGRAQVSLLDVIGSVEKASGGRVVGVEIEHQKNLLSSKNGPLMYEVESVIGGTMTTYFADATTGKIIKQKKNWCAALDFDAPWKSADFAQVKVSMAQAVADAEKATSGKAMSAKLRVRHGVLFYNIRTVTDGNVKVVLIDPDNGKIYQAPQYRHTKCGHK